MLSKTYTRWKTRFSVKQSKAYGYVVAAYKIQTKVLNPAFQTHKLIPTLFRKRTLFG